MPDVEIAYWLGSALSAAALFAYLCTAFYPRKDYGHTVALLMSLVALAHVYSHSSLIKDMGYVHRTDGITFNYARWIAIGASGVFGSLVAGIYMWHTLVEGWTMVFAGGLSALVFTFVGLSADAKVRWTAFPFALLSGAVFLAVLLLRGRYNKIKSERSKTSVFLTTVFAIAYACFYALAFFVLFFSDAFLKVASQSVQEWLYLLALSGLLFVPFIAVWDYHRAPAEAKDE